MKRVVWVVVSLVVLCVMAGPAVAEEKCEDAVAGSIRTLKGNAEIVRGEVTVPAEIGDRVVSGDVLKTLDGASMGVLFRDDTSISMGPKSEIRIDEFVFAPAEKELSLVTKISRGTAAIISGQIAKLDPDSMRVETPLTIIGVRGTRFVVKVEGD